MSTFSCQLFPTKKTNFTDVYKFMSVIQNIILVNNSIVCFIFTWTVYNNNDEGYFDVINATAVKIKFY